MNTRQHYNGHTGRPKRPHDTEAEAKAKAKELAAKFKTDMRWYRCGVCGKFHTGNLKYIPHQDRTLERVINWFKRVFA